MGLPLTPLTPPTSPTLTSRKSEQFKTKDGRPEKAEKKRKAAELGNSLSIHGLPHIFVAQHVALRLVWVVVFFGGLTTLAIMTYTRVQSFYSRSVMWNEQRISKRSIAIPMIAVCDYRLDRSLQSPKTIELRSCSFEQMDCIDSLSWRYDSMNICFYVNTTALKQTQAGPDFGLELVFAVKNTPPPSGSMKASYKAISLQLFLFEDGYYPMQTTNRNLLSPQYHHDIPIEKVEINRLPSPYPSNCKSGYIDTALDNNPYDRKCAAQFSAFENATDVDDLVQMRGCKNRTYVYNNEACMHEHLKHILEDTCDASEHQFYFDSENSESIMTCVDDTVSSLTDADWAKCPLPCANTKFDAIVNRLPWPEDHQQSDEWEAMREGKPVGEMSKGPKKVATQTIMSMNLFYKDMMIKQTNETMVYTATSLVSDLGGLMGLFLGASIYSLIELIMLLFVSITDLCTCFRRKSEDEDNNNEKA